MGEKASAKACRSGTHLRYRSSVHCPSLRLGRPGGRVGRRAAPMEQCGVWRIAALVDCGHRPRGPAHRCSRRLSVPTARCANGVGKAPIGHRCGLGLRLEHLGHHAGCVGRRVRTAAEFIRPWCLEIGDLLTGDFGDGDCGSFADWQGTPASADRTDLEAGIGARDCTDSPAADAGDRADGGVAP